MCYHIDDSAMSLGDLMRRLESAALIPSQQVLLDRIAERMAALEEAGVTNVADLRAGLRTAKRMAALAEASGIDPDYLTMLRRAVEGFFPKPQPLKAFTWARGKTVAGLEKAGVRDTKQLYEAALSGVAPLAKKAGLRREDLAEMIAVADLSRVQWVSPAFARVLTAAGYDSAARVAGAEPERLFSDVERANEGARVYKGKVGLRDMKRLIAAAAFVP